MAPMHKYVLGPAHENVTISSVEYLEEGRGEAAYVITMLTVYAVSIAFMIGYMSFKKNKYKQWDREANQYLNSYYKRQIKHEKVHLQTFADKFNPGMTMLFATGFAIGQMRFATNASQTRNPPEGSGEPMLEERRSRTNTNDGQRLSIIDEEDSPDVKGAVAVQA